MKSKALRAAAARLARGRDAGLAAVFLVIAAGMAEVAGSAFKLHVLDRFVGLATGYVWMTPVSYLGHMRIPIALAVLAAMILPRVPLHYIVVLPIAIMGAFGVLLLAETVHTVALVLLAVGIGASVTRWWKDHPARASRTAALGAPALAMIIATIAVVSLVGGRTERARYGSDRVTASSGVNLLFIILDTVRGTSMGLLGYPENTTPRLESWATRGVSFDNAWVTAPWTLPTHATLFTGRYPSTLSATWTTPLDDEYPMLAEAFSEAGYRTAAFSANQWYVGFESGLMRGFDHFEVTRPTYRQLALSSTIGQWKSHGKERTWTRQWDRKWAEEINQQFLAWLEGRPSPKPFFAFLNYYDAHSPYDRREPFLRQVSGSDEKTTRALYDAGIARVDQYLGELLDSLDALGVLDSTIVVISADHGELVGEHGLQRHGNALYRELLSAPLVLFGPGIAPAGARVAETVSLRDVPATLFDITRIRTDLDIPGTSLRPLWEGRSAPHPSPAIAMVHEGIRTPPEDPVSRGEMWSIIDGRWHYILNGDGVEELYDIVADPSEEQDLVAAGRGGSELERLRRAVVEARQRDSAMSDRRQASAIPVQPGRK